jgi:hypothetical protein
MTTVSLKFPGPLSTKRRRMRSGGNVSVTISGSTEPFHHNNINSTTAPDDDISLPPEDDEGENISEQKTTQTSKCKNSTTIPIFLKSKLVCVGTVLPAEHRD